MGQLRGGRKREGKEEIGWRGWKGMEGREDTGVDELSK